MTNIHLLGVCVCIVCPGGAVSGTGHLNGSWFLTAQGYTLDWLGDVSSTVSSCQLSGGACYLPIHMQIACFVWSLSDLQQCAIIAFVSSLIDILSVSYFVYVSCINFI